MNKRLKKALLLSTVMASGLLASCSVVRQMPDNAATMPQTAVPASKILLSSVEEKMYTLETPPELRSLTPEQRIGRVEVLKKNIEGFNLAQTAKIAGALERLFSIDQEHIRALADNIPDGLKIKNALKYENINEVSGTAFYLSDENAMYLFPGHIDKQHPIEIAARIAHELNHGKQSVQGILNPLPAYVDAGKYIAVKMAVEADSKVMHQSVFHTLAEREKKLTGKRICWHENTGEQAAQNVYDEMFRQSCNQVKAKFLKMDEAALQNAAATITGGKYMTYLLSGKDAIWNSRYMMSSTSDISEMIDKGVAFAARPNDKVVDYIFSKLAQKYRISKDVFLRSEQNFLKKDTKAFFNAVQNFKYDYSYQDTYKIYIQNKSKLETKTFSSASGLLRHFKRAESAAAVEKQGNIYVYRSAEVGR